jgi:hypothetical protein
MVDIRFVLALIYEPLFTKITSLVFLNLVISWKIIYIFNLLMFDIEQNTTNC